MKLLPKLRMIRSLVFILFRTTSHNFFCQKRFCPVMIKRLFFFFLQKYFHTLKRSTKYTDYFEIIVHSYNKIRTLIPNNLFNAVSNSLIPPFFLFWIWDFTLYLVLLRLSLNTLGFLRSHEIQHFLVCQSSRRNWN